MIARDFFLVVALGALTASAGQFRVPLTTPPPRLDGKIEPREWRAAVGLSGFGFRGTLDRRKATAYVAATRTHIYVAIRSQLPDEGELLARVHKNSVKVVYDDSIEVWLDPTPGSEHGQIFQMLANPLGYVGYKHHARGKLRENPTWQGNWQVANGFHGREWHCEVAIPIEEVAPGRDVTDGAWGINVCRNWKQPWAFSSTGGQAYAPTDTFVFSARDALAVHHAIRRDPFLGQIDHRLVVFNPGDQPASVQASLVLARDAMPTLRAEKSLTLAPGREAALALKADDQSTRKFKLTIRVASPDGKTIHYQRTIAWQAGKPWRWVAKKKEVLPIDCQFAYYPYLNRFRLLADVSNLPPGARLDRLVAVIRKKGARRPVKSVVLDRFVNGRQEISFDLPPLEGTYELALKAYGEKVPKGELVKEFERKRFPWERKGLGTSQKVFPPFEPIRVEGRKLRVVFREHTIGDLGLWDQVAARGKDLLAGPMRLVAVVAGKPTRAEGTGLRFVEAKPHEAIATATLAAGPLKGNIRTTWDYDGLMRVDLTLEPTATPIEALRLEVPLEAQQATMLHAMADGIRNTVYIRIPQGDGIVWDATKVQVNDFPRNFCTYIYLGTPVRGLCWFAENDRGWSWDASKPNLDVVRRPGQVVLRVHLFNKSTTIAERRTLTFGLMAAPVKPRVGNWRYAWKRENYTLLGTDINWFARGNCGSVYPAAKDLYLWEMLKRGNRQRLTNSEIEKVIARGKPYFEPYGPAYVERFVRHVHHNLRARYGAKMVFYYNRASCQLFPEFQTFQDEWSLTDFRTVGKGNGVGEIKIVPSPSYIDHALWWYGKSFDVAGNQGVYWDNYYFAASYNTAMTGAYKRPDGSIMPSTGLWGLRELVKRTFVFMNERGMRPITMVHMTSTGILPLYSFATVQYDWEWKYSQGDVQYRFPREYILLVSTGELAGTWPVLLSDHGKLARDEWTQRTFAAVCLVHELDGWGGGKAWRSLFAHVHRLVETPGVEVYRYWDDRPQPIVANDPDLPTIVYSLKGKEALFAVTSYADEDRAATITIDPKPLGLEAGYSVVDAETGQAIPVRNDRFTLRLKKHDVREFRLLPTKKN